MADAPRGGAGGGGGEGGGEEEQEEHAAGDLAPVATVAEIVDAGVDDEAHAGGPTRTKRKNGSQ